MTGSFEFSQGVKKFLLMFLLVLETALRVSKTQVVTVFFFFLILKTFYTPERVYESSSQGVQLNTLSNLLVEEVVLGVSRRLAVTRLLNA